MTSPGPCRLPACRRRISLGFAVAALFCLGAGPVMAQVPLPPRHRATVPPSCHATVRYFGVGSVTLAYRFAGMIGTGRYWLPRHALPQIIGHTGSMGAIAFLESQRGQVVTLLSSAACRYLSDQQPMLRQTITDRHGRRVGMITAVLIHAEPGTAS